MRSLRAWLLRLSAVLSSRRSERDLSAELESHLQLHTDDNVRAGMTPQEARRRAVMALGGVEQTKERYRDRRGVPGVESLLRDLRYGARTLLKSRGFALAGVLILGLGIGANAAIFTIVNAVVLKPLPFADADRIMRLWHTPPPALFPGALTFTLSPANFVDWEAQNEVFERMAIYRSGRMILTGSREPEAVVAFRASADFLPALGLAPTLGRGFSRDEDRDGGSRGVLLSKAFFHTRFGGNPSVLGTTLVLNRIPHTIIGVVPDAPVFINRAQVYVPLAWTAQERANRSNHNYLGIAKLKPGVDVARAQSDMTAIAKRLEAQYPEDNKDWGTLVRPLQEDMTSGVRGPLGLLLGAVALVLLIACANLGNLMLARTHSRAKEIALRGALGASRPRIVQQLLAEGLVLGAGGGLAGLAAAYYGVDVLKAAFGTALPRVNEVAIDARVLAVTAIAALTTGLLSAFVPAWRLSGRDGNDTLKTGSGRGTSEGGDGRIRNLLVVSEVTLAIMLLIGAGLLMRSLSGLRAVDPGFDPHNVLTALVSIPPAKYATPEERNQFFDRARQNVLALPGVQSAAWIDNVPLQGGSSQYVMPEGLPPMRESEMPVVALRTPSPGYFETTRIQLLAGRDFTDADNRYGAPRVVIVSEQTVQRFWPGQNPLGKRITLTTMATKEPSEVVGVVREVKLDTLDASAANSETAVYAPAAQFGRNGATIVVRTAGEPAALSRALVSAIQQIDPEQPVLDIKTLDDIAEESLGQRPLLVRLLAVFALLAMTLASIGIYSVLAYTVRQRVREIGIRMALGAPARGVLGLVVLEGLKPTLVGVALGLGLAAGLVGAMRSLLYGVSQHDPGTFGAVAAIMLMVGVVATLVPAYRATRVDPVVTLRAE